MKKGSYYFVIQFPIPWPVTKNCVIIKSPVDSTELIISTTPKGNLEVLINENTEDEIRFSSQPIIFQNYFVILTVFWSDNKISLRINETYIGPVELVTPVLVEGFNNGRQENFPTDIGLVSWLDAKAIDQCRVWMEWRILEYGNPIAQPGPNRRLKSVQEQTEELSKVLEPLKYFLQQLKTGNNVFLTSLLPILRSLLFWPDRKSKNYKPLLLRIGALKKLPLPVYALHTTKNYDRPDFLNIGYIEYKNNIPSIYKSVRTPQLMDFQEWLHTELIFKPQEPIVLGKNPFRVKDLIFEAANTIGTAHYDPDIPIPIDYLKNSFINEREFFTEFIINISSITLALSKYVLDYNNDS
ncbi:hypothetical protein AAE02nite_42390 [Adhaeribacter aerolatus]|uniref:Uncharacterized protein n=1 Tax=Adhaeribacter aerolatus TaxID=670289 RepID=A0A512B3P0_9BACT|nr:hypothetical protein [Adhaeribacter aerolatus]GEO06575.1 hypothetical protein AAE02nite_42390 [Adhaeribacter aerolatus]